MMNRTAYRALLVFALFHLLSDVAYAGGAILCVGPDDHRAIESQHLAESGCRAGNETLPAGPSLAGHGAASQDCTDSPLHTEAELVSSDPSSTSQLAVASILTRIGIATTGGSQLGAHIRAPVEASALRAHRTVVLLI